jgi:hypothetical protein
MSSAATSPAAVPRKGNFQRFWRALKQLFLEMMGAVFAFAGLILLSAALRSWNNDTARWPIAGAVGFALLFFFFALSSFRRARKL